MARTTDHARHEDIAWRAFKAMRRRGVHSVTMSEVAADLGMKRSSLYWYFDSIDAIFLAALERTSRRLVLYVAERVAENSHPVDHIHGWMEATAEFYADDADSRAVLARLWAISSDADSDSGFEGGHALFKAPRDSALSVVRSGLAKGSVHACEPETLVDLCAATVDGLLVQLIHHGVHPGAGLAMFREAVLKPLARRPAIRATAGWSVEED